MMVRARFALVALFAVALLAFGLAAHGAAPQSGSARDTRVLAHGARIASSVAAPGERRAPVAKSGVVPARSGASAGLVRVLAAVASVASRAAPPAATRSRAPPA